MAQRGVYPFSFLIILLLTVGVYVRSLNNSFVGDDRLVIADNMFVKSPSNLPLIFTRHYLTSPEEVPYLNERDIGSGEVTYRPVVTLTYFADYALWKLNAFGYHLTNFFLHLINVFLFYMLAGLLVKERNVAFFAGLLFAVHPVHAEAVMGISFREDLLAFLFAVSSLIFYIKARQDNKASVKGKYFLSLICYFFALFSKESAVVLPLLIFLYDYFLLPQRQGWPEKVRRYAGYALISLFYLWVWFFPMARSSAYHASYAGGSFYTNCLTMMKVIATDISWLLMPVDIHMTRPDPAFTVRSIFSAQAWISLATVAFFLILPFKMKKNRAVFSFCFLWFFAALLPVLNIIPIQNIIACRYLYFPAGGFFLGVSLLIKEVFSWRLIKESRLVGAVLRTFVAGFFILCMIITLSLGYIWRNELSVLYDSIRHYPNDSELYRTLANIYARQGLMEETERLLQMAKKLAPGNADICVDLGELKRQQGKWQEALGYFQYALNLNPYQDTAQNGICVVFADRGETDEAANCFRQLLVLNPRNFYAYFNLGIIYQNQKKWNLAQEAWREALRLKPHSEDVQRALNSLQDKVGSR